MRQAIPCKPTCPLRTATCKFDGTCDEYAAWKKAYDAAEAIRKKNKFAYTDAENATYTLRRYNKSHHQRIF